MNNQKFPKGWNADKIASVVKAYESQSEDEATTEDEAAFEFPDHTFIEVPTAIVPKVRELIANHDESKKCGVSPLPNQSLHPTVYPLRFLLAQQTFRLTPAGE